jgi:hypothetical protein
MILSFFGFIGFTLTYYFSAVTFQEPGQALPTWQEHFLVVPIGMVCQALFFLSPGGAGAGELVFGWLYQLLNYDKDLGVLMSLTQRVITWIVGLAGYLVYLRMRPGLEKSSRERDDSTTFSRDAESSERSARVAAKQCGLTKIDVNRLHLRVILQRILA